MAKTEQNWSLNSYTNSEWTDLVAEAGTVAALVIANCSTDSPGDRVVEARIIDTASSPDAVLARILAPTTLATGDTKVFDLRSINVKAGQALQVKADAVDVDFFASGVVDA